MKRFLALIFAMVSVIALRCETIHHTMEFDRSLLSVGTEEFNGVQYAQIGWSDMMASGDDGEYALPMAYASFAIPCNVNNVSVKNVKLTIGDKIKLAHPLSLIRNSVSYQDVSYTSSGPTLQALEKIKSPVTILANENFQDISNILTVKILPVNYKVNDDMLEVYDKIEFDIEYSVSTQMRKLSSASNEDKYYLDELAIIQSIVVNPEFLDADAAAVRNRKLIRKSNVIDPEQVTVSKRCVVSGMPMYEYCIVTSRSLASAFQPLVSLKKIQGMDAGIVCMEDILANENFSKGDTISEIYDDAGKLRRYLYFAHQNGTRFVLLGGKPPIVPIRYGALDYSKYEGRIPSDLYFGNVTCDWDKNRDGVYGSSRDAISYNCQLYVGRLLCKSKQEITNYVNKLEIYSLNPGNGDYSYLARAFINFSYGFFKSAQADSLGLSSQFPGSLEVLNSIKQCDYNLTENYQHLEFPTGSEVLSMLNNQKYGFFTLISHGSPEGISVKYYYPNEWSQSANGINALDGEYVWFPEEKKNGLDRLNNFMYPSYSYTEACSTMPFDSPTYLNFGQYDPQYNKLSYNYGESYINGQNYGGVAYLGNTRAVYSLYRGRLFSSFFEKLNNALNNISAHFLYYCGVSEAISKYKSVTPNVHHGSRLAHNMLGDPAVAIWLKAPIVSENYTIDRLLSEITVVDKSYQDSRQDRLLIAIEPDGTVVSRPFMFKEAVLHNVSPSSLIYVIEDEYKPFVGDAIIQNATYNQNSYFYVSSLETGNDVAPNRWPTGDVVIDNDVSVTFDVQHSVKIKKGTVIKAGATLNIITPERCTIEDVTIEPGGKLQVYTADYTLKESYPMCKGEILIYKNNKYFEQIKDLRDRYPLRSQKVGKSRVKDYTPMLEVGKEWRYTQRDYAIYKPQSPDRSSILKIVDKLDFEGKELFLMQSFWDGSLTPEQDSDVYLWEDKENRKVWWMVNFEKPSARFNICLYDFNDFNEGDVTRDLFLGDVTECVYESKYGSYQAWSDTYGCYKLVEGLGVVGTASAQDFCTTYGDIFTFMGTGCPGDCGYLPLLYEIADGDGNIIYSLDSGRPGASVEAPGFTETAITVSDGGLEVISAKEIGDVMIVSAAGATVFNGYVADTRFVFAMDHLLPGVYILHANGNTRKFMVR